MGALAACAESPQSALDPHGPAAERILSLGLVMTVAGTAVSLLVIALLAVAAWRRRPDDPDEPTRRSATWGPQDAGRPGSNPGMPRDAVPPSTTHDDRSRLRWILAGGVALPVVMLIPLLLYTLAVLGFTTARDERAAVTIDAHGKRWWWEFTYLDGRGGEPVTANEIYIPVGQRVVVHLRSDNVIHSFWVPELQGKVDQIPGRTNTMWLQADRPGRYRGQCAEYCGVQHANMLFWVVAVAQDEFDAWLATQRRPAAPPADSLARAGLDAFMRNGCGVCHRIRGTEAGGRMGPDLTHVASRLTLAAGTIPNTPGHLGGWVSNPQQIKPGNLMPHVPLEAAELLALLHYLETLR